MTRLLLALLLVGCETEPCRDKLLGLQSTCWEPGARLQREHETWICRCRPFAPAASGSVRP
jgi:hypothetical protein